MGDTTGPQRKHVEVLHSLRDRRYKALKEALELRQAGVRGTQAAGLRDLCRGLLSEIRALDAALAHLLVADTQELLVQTVQFYGDPESYMAIGFFPDRPCGDFIEDFEDHRRKCSAVVPEPQNGPWSQRRDRETVGLTPREPVYMPVRSFKRGMKREPLLVWQAQ